MTQPKRKKDEMAEIVKLIQETVPGDFVKVLENSIHRIIEAELSTILGAGHYERSEDRTNYRNGYRERQDLATAMGPVSIKIPKLRKGGYYPSILEHYQRVDRALISIVSEAYINGVSTRKMNNLFVDLGLENIDRSFVSRCSAQIDAEVEVWKNRELDRRYAYIWLDAIYTKIRTKHGVQSTAVLIAIGLREDGHRDVLGLQLGNKESYYNWKDFLQSLKERGLERSELWISDEHDGLIKSIEECFPGQLRQRCIVHWMRNAQSKVSKTDLLWLVPLIKDLVGSRTKDSFALAWNELSRVVEAKSKDKLRDWLDSTYHEITVYLDFPPAHWSRIKCTNSLERLNEELRRREKCIRIFPNEMSCIRLIGAILQGYSEDWTSGKIYLADPIEKIAENMERPLPGQEFLRDGLKPCSVGYASSAGLQPVAIRSL
ncbi:MAG: IS256 family transposase [Candidatus Cloacimonetes bacterium]|nr:IS256 family transposase [Candidatus Cloacimonadota bacterium]